MQGNELHYFRNIIDRDLSHLVAQRLPVTRHYVQTFKHELSLEIEAIKANISMSAFLHQEQNRLQVYIRACQQNILILVAHVGEYANPFRKSIKFDHTIICKNLYVSLEDLLGFIESHYEGYLDKNSWIPLRYKQLISYDVAESLTEIDNSLAKLKINPELKQLALAPFHSLNTERELTYQRLQYIRDLKKNLHKFVSEPHEEKADEDLMYLLFRLNYNAEDYCEFNFRTIQQHLKTQEDITGQLETLAHIQKLVNQALIKNGIAYESHSGSIKEILSEWLEEEINFLLIVQKARATDLTNFSEDENLEKFRINLPSEEILFICYIYVELGILDKNRVTDLVKGLSRLTSTKRKANLSWSSLRKKFYNAESRTINSVGVLLKEMQKIVDKLRGLK
jgi:hypothetical protein